MSGLGNLDGNTEAKDSENTGVCWQGPLQCYWGGVVVGSGRLSGISLGVGALRLQYLQVTSWFEDEKQILKPMVVQLLLSEIDREVISFHAAVRILKDLKLTL